VILKKIKNWKIDGRMMCFIENLKKERTLRVAVGNTLSNNTKIENGVVQGAVLSQASPSFSSQCRRYVTESKNPSEK
jgi:hypothetical protein